MVCVSGDRLGSNDGNAAFAVLEVDRSSIDAIDVDIDS